MKSDPHVEENPVLAWEKRIREAIAAGIELIVCEEAEAAAARVQERVNKAKLEIIGRATERIRIMQRFSPGEIRFEVVIQG